MTVRPVTVLVVDDQPVFLRAAGELIAASPGFVQVGQAGSGHEALELAAALSPDLVLLDVRMPGMDGVETARRLQRADPDAVVVLVSIADLRDVAPLACPSVTAHLRKQSLSARALEELWAAHGHPRAGRAPA